MFLKGKIKEEICYARISMWGKDQVSIVVLFKGRYNASTGARIVSSLEEGERDDSYYPSVHLYCGMETGHRSRGGRKCRFLLS